MRTADPYHVAPDQEQNSRMNRYADTILASVGKHVQEMAETTNDGIEGRFWYVKNLVPVQIRFLNANTEYMNQDQLRRKDALIEQLKLLDLRADALAEEHEMRKYGPIRNPTRQRVRNELASE